MPKKKSEKVMFTMRMDKDVHRELKKRATAENRSLANFVERTLKQIVHGGAAGA